MNFLRSTALWEFGEGCVWEELIILDSDENKNLIVPWGQD